MLRELLQRFPCRERELIKLYQLYGRKCEQLPGVVYVYGVDSTGKSSLVMQALRAFDQRCAVVNLVCCHTARALYEELLRQLRSVNEGSEVSPCEHLVEFVAQLSTYENCANSGLVLVLDGAERLRDMESNVLPAFLRLRELVSLNVSVIMISTLDFSKLVKKIHVSQPILLHFPQYTQDEMQKILMQESSYMIQSILNTKDLTEYRDVYQNYLCVLLSIFYRNCRDLSELRYQARKNFSSYCRPILESHVKPSDVQKLWLNISPVLKASLDTVYMRIQTVGSDVLSLSCTLPFYAKYLLIAAYLASHNPAKEDRRLFIKAHGGKGSKKGKARGGAPECSLEMYHDPRQFSHDRLLAIFYSLLGDRTGLCAILMSQISTLVQMQLLAPVADGANLSMSKFRCNVDFECIQSICKSVDFNIRKYLFNNST